MQVKPETTNKQQISKRAETEQQNQTFGTYLGLSRGTISETEPEDV